ncbi:NAD(P)/FAD-dependent oxidoreductase [Geoglobus acetivorans]|uniref:NAD(P)/FAD-dependent oxidoreductase n=1 Tax=Geoglobus acetivorans TaxID=565033 RepID=A0ABZ3H316_GEOAI|nr:NAD(P)/FAD-dependent oxidoreductase [Geoglobus acetivorans]
MRIQIYGAGMAGSYLYMLLRNNGDYELGIRDERNSPDCRCAWGIAYRQAKNLYRDIGLDLDDYIISRPRYAYANGIRFRVKNIVMFDRKRLLQDLWKELEFREIENPDIVVDATGSKRAFLPEVGEDDVHMRYHTVQYIEEHEKDEDIYAYARRTGYAWAFPLGEGRWHIGAGDKSVERAEEMVKKLREKYGFEEREKSCGCRGFVRMYPPSKSLPFRDGNVYGVGEAIGCISGFGEGNAPALHSAKVFYDCLTSDCLDKYETRILEEFRWVEDEFGFLEAVQRGDMVSALRLTRKVIRIESERSAELTFRDILKVITNLKP